MSIDDISIKTITVVKLGEGVKAEMDGHVLTIIDEFGAASIHQKEWEKLKAFAAEIGW